MDKTIEQKIIKIGDSKGVILPASYLKDMHLGQGDMIRLAFSKVENKFDHNDNDPIKKAKEVMNRYRKDFENLAKR